MPAVISAYAWQQDVFEAAFDPAIRHIAALGTRGPGKSWTAQHVAVARALAMPETQHIIFRRTSDDVVKQYAPKMRETLANFGGVRVPFNYNSTYKVLTVSCPRGGTSRIYLAFAEVAKHAEKHQSQEYATVIFDEITHFEEIIPQLISGSVRGHTNLKQLVFGNPGGVGHAWVRKRYIQASPAADTLVLQPKLRDNLWLNANDPDYADRLMADLPAWKRAQWIDGDWDAREGAYWSVPAGAVREMKVPYYAHWWAGVDWGYWPSSFGVIWIAAWQDPHDRAPHIHVVQELKRTRLEVDEQAAEALEMEEQLRDRFRAEHGIDIRVRARWADPSTARRVEGDSAEAGRTIATIWARNGFYTTPATRHGRVPGWQLIRLLLRPRYGLGTPGEHGVLTIDPACGALLSEFEDAEYERNQSGAAGEDLAGEDHLLDPLRYFVTSVYGMRFGAQLKDSYGNARLTAQ